MTVSLARRSGAVPSAVALALTASLAGAPQLLQPQDDDHPHRCACPAGPHLCTCGRCLAAAQRAHAHPAVEKGRSCCRGAGASARRPGSDHQRPPSGAHCVSASCGDVPVAATLAAGADPFVVPRHPGSPPSGRAERFAPVTIPSGGDRAAPEPPPPRA